MEERKASVTDKAKRCTTLAASKLHIGRLKKTAHDVKLWGVGSAFQTLGWGARGVWSGPREPHTP